MSDLAGWLRATIEGDKADALSVSDGPNRPETWTAAQYKDGNRGWEVAGRHSHVVGGVFEKDAEHIARHDPRDTVARCEADLAILDEHKHYLANAPDSADNVADFGCGTCHVHPHDGGTYGEGWCRTVRLLAWGYRHRDLAGYAAVAGGWEP